MNNQMLIAMTGTMMEDAAQTARNTEATAKEVASLREELVRVKAELEQSRQDFASYKAEQDKQREADAAQGRLDKKQNRRDIYISAAFSVCFTLFLEHLFDIVRFIQLAVEKALSFLH